MTERVEKYHTAIVGGGSAATGVLVAAEARKPGTVQGFANTKGIAWIADTIGAGRIADYRINGNSDPGDFVEGTPQTGVFGRLWTRGSRAQLLHDASGSVRLAGDVAPFLAERASVAKEVVGSASASDVYEGEKATRVNLKRKKRTVTTESGRKVKAKRVVLATGGKEKELPDFKERFGEQYKLSSEIITESDTALEDITGALRAGKKVAFVAASHSTYAAIAKILGELGGNIEQGQIVVISKKEPLLYFKNGEEAQQVGYEYTSENVCPKTGKVNRFGGLRNDAKDAALDPRIEFVKVDQSVTPDHEAFTGAAYVVSGIGYETNLVTIYNKKGKKIDIQSSDGQVEVDHKGRVLDTNGKRIKRVYGTGLGYGPRPTRDLGGEPAFSGRLDGVNVQDTISGKIIAKQIFGKR